MRLSAAICPAAPFGCLLLTPAPAPAADGETTPLNLQQPKVDASQAANTAGGGGLVRTVIGPAIVSG